MRPAQAAGVGGRFLNDSEQPPLLPFLRPLRPGSLGRRSQSGRERERGKEGERERGKEREREREKEGEREREDISKRRNPSFCVELCCVPGQQQDTEK